MLSFFIPALNNLAIRIKKGFFFFIMASCLSRVISGWLRVTLTFKRGFLRLETRMLNRTVPRHSPSLYGRTQAYFLVLYLTE